MSATALPPPVISLPQVSIELRVGIDRIRRCFRNDAELQAMAFKVGPSTCVKSCDLPAIQKLLEGKS